MEGFDLSSINLAEIIVNPRAGIVPLIWFVGWLLSNSRVSNRWLPLVLTILGVGLGVGFYESTAGYLGGGVIGAIYAMIAVGVHSSKKNVTQS